MISLKTNNWRIDNVDTIIFDKDGTFIDLHYFWGKMTELRALEIIKTFNLKETVFDKICIYLGYNAQTKKMLPDGITAMYSRIKIIEILKKNLEELNIYTTEKEIETIFDIVSEKFYKDITKYIKPIDCAIEFIKEVHKRGIKLGIVTSDSLKSTEITLNHLNLNKYFSSIIGRESSLFTKESGKLTRIALQELDANPETTIMIGDTPTDYFSAKNAMINKTILVATGQINIDDLAKISPYTINKLSEVKII